MVKLGYYKELFHRVLIPNAVKEELLRIKAIHLDIEQMLSNEWIEVKEIQNKEKLSELNNDLYSKILKTANEK